MKAPKTQFQLDYEMYLGSTFTPSGRLNPVPNNHWLAYRYAAEEYRRNKRDNVINMSPSELDKLSFVNDPRAGSEGTSERHYVNETYVYKEPDPEQRLNYNDLVNKVLTALEKRNRDRDLCRYFATMIYQLDGLDLLTKEVRPRVVKYLEDVDLSKVGKFDRDIAEALNFRVEAGSQSRKLVSVKKRLADRVRVLGITKIDIFGV